jgi:hypothetical protein
MNFDRSLSNELKHLATLSSFDIVSKSKALSNSTTSQKKIGIFKGKEVSIRDKKGTIETTLISFKHIQIATGFWGFGVLGFWV